MLYSACPRWPMADLSFALRPKGMMNCSTKPPNIPPSIQPYSGFALDMTSGPVQIHGRSVQLLQRRPRGMKLDSMNFLAELERLERMNSFARPSDVPNGSVIGVDEVGTGALAGPVVSCAVVLPDSPLFEGLNDSKKLTANRRCEIFSSLYQTEGVFIGVGEMAASDVDFYGISNVRIAAMEMAVKEVLADIPQSPELFLVDGNIVLGGSDIPTQKQKPIIRGDQKCAAIAAASIVAKVTRDRRMAEVAETWPEYGFAHNVGYGTKAHVRALKLHGPCDIHRRSYKPVREASLARS